MMTWSFGQVWNESLANREERELKPREHIWAGEVGGAFIDRYLKMNATIPTNPPNARSLRKFEAGNMMEWLVELVLRRAGILIEKQKWLEYQYPDLLRVTGKLDHLAGGNPDWEKAVEEIKSLELPEFFNRGTYAIIDHFREKFPDGLKEIVIEVKSTSSMQFDMRERTKQPQPQHALQLFHYLKALDLPEGHIVYVSKDDLRMIEFGIFNPSPIEDIYKADIAKMTEFIRTKTEPDKEPLISFDGQNGKFSKNWRVEYSNYLTMLYGYERPDIYADEWSKKAGQFNRVFGRCVTGANMTKLNLEVIEEVKKTFPNFEDMVTKGKELAKKGLLEVEENGENGGNNGIL